jgi:CBS domain-containing protein
MKVKDIMTAHPACCTAGDTAQRAAELMKEHDCGLIPVVEDTSGNRLVAVVTDRDLALRVLARGKGADAPVRDAMTDGPDAVHPDDDVSRVEEIMSRAQVRRVPVVDADNKVVGIVAQADLAQADQGVSDRKVGEVVEDISRPR